MSEYMFGCGPGHLGKRAERIAQKHGADLVNYTNPGCSCGQGCAYACKNNKRHWFATENRGSPFNDQLAYKVLTELEKAGIIKP